jgi:UDP-glucuronate 4-epimerase
MKNKILITGAAGFIGFHLVQALMQDSNNEIFGLDNLNCYYPVDLKYARLLEVGVDARNLNYLDSFRGGKHNNFCFIKLSLENKDEVFELFRIHKFDYVINLAAQAGVRNSIDNPYEYIDSNIIGFQNIIEAARNYPPRHFIHASSSSVYGENSKVPFSEDDTVEHPISLYAATKKSNELIGYTYSHLYKIPITNLRFFTVYGPWGRPDMAPFIFTRSILKGEKIKVFNNGNMFRDFTYVDDIIDGILKVLYTPFDGQILNRVYNIGQGKPIKLLRFIEILEDTLQISAIKEFLPKQPGDVFQTYADTKKLESATGYLPSTSLEVGIRKFVKWYLSSANPLL